MPQLPNVNITLENGALGGTIATADGTVGLVCTGATESTVTVGTPFLVSNLTAIQVLPHPMARLGEFLTIP